MSTHKKSGARPPERIITFEITTTHALPVGQQVFISGNIEMLGAWRPDGFPLTRLEDNLWTGYAVVTNDVEVEFKITRGSWRSEEADESGTALTKNQKLPPPGNVAYKHTIARWIDRL